MMLLWMMPLLSVGDKEVIFNLTNLDQCVE